MIKIIKDGNIYELECQNCNCYFSYQKEDTYYKKSHIQEVQQMIICPWCRKELIIIGKRGFDYLPLL